MQIEQVHDIERLEEFLRPFPIEHAFVLGYLDPAYAEECRWYARTVNGVIRTLVTVYMGMSRPAVFVHGHADGVTPILRQFRSELPERALVRSPKNCIDAVRTSYHSSTNLREMQRMGLERSIFSARDNGQDDPLVEQLSHRDTGAILATYAHWPDNFFDPYQLSSGLYFGIRGDGDDIASIAGIHNLSAKYDVAAIGNLVTHPSYRGRGYAQRCNAVLLRRLFSHVGLVTLDVQSGNVAAIRTYQHFGFQPRAEFFEGEMTLKG